MIESEHLSPCRKVIMVYNICKYITAGEYLDGDIIFYCAHSSLRWRWLQPHQAKTCRNTCLCMHSAASSCYTVLQLEDDVSRWSRLLHCLSIYLWMWKLLTALKQRVKHLISRVSFSDLYCWRQPRQWKVFHCYITFKQTHHNTLSKPKLSKQSIQNAFFMKCTHHQKQWKSNGGRTVWIGRQLPLLHERAQTPATVISQQTGRPHRHYVLLQNHSALPILFSIRRLHVQ